MDLVPFFREIPFDTNTAVTAFAKIRDGRYAFLLESVIGGEKWARYTFLGSAPREVLKLKGTQIQRWTPDAGWDDVDYEGDPLAYLDARLREKTVTPVPGLPRF
ncbi:MAG TPA: hypothetical protein VM100_07555, partial [Longimicrobiales bacterium]|nr:hypothetical protein [Longimicrobiales bacterium]